MSSPTSGTDATVSPAALQRWLQYNYESHEAAAESFIRAGIAEAVLIPEYTSTTFRQRLQAKILTVVHGARVIDLTAKVPTTPAGDLTEVVKLMHTCREQSRQNPKAIFYFQRTPENSTAFVHLMAYGNNLEPPEADAELPGPATDASYAGVAIFRENEITVPARLCVSSAELMAEFVASMLDAGYHGFKCGECHQPFVRWQLHRGQHVRALDELLLTNCDHVFHPGCIVARMRTSRPNRNRCPVCAVPLPISAFPSDGAIRLDDHVPLSVDEPVSEAERAGVEPDPAKRFHAAVRAEYNANALKRSGFSTTLVPTRAAEGGHTVRVTLAYGNDEAQ